MAQVIGVGSVFPFLALAADPSRLRNSGLGSKILSFLPPMDDAKLLLVAGLFAITMLVVASVSNILGLFIRTKYSQEYAHWLRQQIVERLLARPYADFLTLSTGILLKKVMGDAGQFSNAILLNLLDTSTYVLTSLLLLVALVLVQPQVAMGAALVLGLFYLVCFIGLGPWRARASSSLKAVTRAGFKELQQIFQGIKPIKVQQAESFFISRYLGHSAIQARYNSLLPVLGSAPRYLIEPIAFGGLVVAVLIFVGRGENLVGILPNLGVMAFAGYRLLPNVQAIYSKLSSLTTSRYVLDEVYEEYQVVVDPAKSERQHKGDLFPRVAPLHWNRELRINGLTFRYPGCEENVLKDFNLLVPRNTSLGIVGQSGSGKSTLVDLILGLHHPSKGQILVDDSPLTPRNRRAWRAGIGYVPQDIFLLDDTVTANIALGVAPSEVDPEAVRRAADAAQLTQFVESELLHGFESQVGERGARLSGGQRQRIGLARALYHQPQLLILDEATSALDKETEAQVMSAINGLQGTVTMLIIAHRLSTVAGCDRILNVADGSVTAVHGETAI